MTKQFIRSVTVAALVIAQIAPALAQRAPGPQPVPVPQPVSPPRPDLPQIQPPRPGNGGPQIQPPRPVGPQPVRPPVRPLPPTPPIGNIGSYAGVIRCESIGNRWRQCNVRTGNRVDLVRRLSGTCQRGRTWGFTRNYVWVEQGCRADFGYGYASTSNPYPQPQPQPQPIRNPDRGPSTGAVIAGVVVAGGLIALLASRKKSSTPNAPASTAPETYPAGPPATLSADLSSLPSAARASVQNCLFDAARQIGVTGGTKLSYDRTTSLEPGNGGWRFGAAVTASYPDGDRALTLYCRATPTQVIQLDFS